VSRASSSFGSAAGYAGVRPGRLARNSEARHVRIESMRYRLRTLLIGSILVVAWALTAALAISLWGEETWRYFAQIP